MDVTRHNFKELWPEIEEVINTASFFAIDGEFTGLYSLSTQVFPNFM